EMAQPLQRVERHLAPAAGVRRRAGAVEHERERRAALGWVESVARRIEADERIAAALQRGEQRPEPVWMFVKNTDRPRDSHDTGGLSVISDDYNTPERSARALVGKQRSELSRHCVRNALDANRAVVAGRSAPCASGRKHDGSRVRAGVYRTWR